MALLTFDTKTMIMLKPYPSLVFNTPTVYLYIIHVHVMTFGKNWKQFSVRRVGARFFSGYSETPTLKIQFK